MASDVPLTIVYPKNVARDGSAPLLLEAYGAYGISEVAGVLAVAPRRGWNEAASMRSPTCAAAASWATTGIAAAITPTKPNSWRDLIAVRAMA